MPFVLTNDRLGSHEQGDEDCVAGWCSQSDGTPVPYVHPKCGGIVHGDLIDQVAVPPSWTVFTGCDKCGWTQQVGHNPEDRFPRGDVPKKLRVVDVPTPPVPPHPAHPEPSPPAKKTSKRAARSK